MKNEYIRKILNSHRVKRLLHIIKIVLYVVRRLVRIYTPFLFSVVMIVNIIKYKADSIDDVYRVNSEMYGHSVFALLYIWATSRHMCKWYKATVYILQLTHVLNLMKVFNIAVHYDTSYILIGICVASIITFLIYRITVGITKILC